MTRTWHEENFGELAIHWKAEGTELRFGLFDREGKLVLEKIVLLSELQIP